MKKFFCILLAIGLSFCFFACGKNTEGISVYMPDGATALSLAYMMENHETIGDTDIQYNVVPPETIAGYAKNNSADMIILPVNAAVNLYKQGAPYKMAAVMTHGNLFVVGKSAASLQDLKGSVVAAIGQGNIPELVFKYILTQNGIEFKEGDAADDDDIVFINYMNEGSDIIKQISQDKAEFGLIAEPAATNATKALSAKGVQVLFNIQTEWNKALKIANPDIETNSAGFPQAALLIKNGTDTKLVDKFLQLCKEGDGWVERTENSEKAVATIKAHALAGTESSMPAVSPEIIARCNLKTMTGVEQYVKDFLDAVGFALPDNFSGLFL